MTDRKEYSPGDTYRTGDYEFFAVHDNDNGCRRCMGDLDDRICDMLPAGCGHDEVAWKPANDLTKHLLAILRLEGDDT